MTHFKMTVRAVCAASRWGPLPPLIKACLWMWIPLAAPTVPNLKHLALPASEINQTVLFAKLASLSVSNQAPLLVTGGKLEWSTLNKWIFFLMLNAKLVWLKQNIWDCVSAPLLDGKIKSKIYQLDILIWNCFESDSSIWFWWLCIFGI